MKLAVCYSTKDRTELTRQTVPVLLDGANRQDFNLFWLDGSDTTPGLDLVYELGYPAATIHMNVRGGADAAIVYALTLALEHPNAYTHVALVENDVLLDPGWLDSTLKLFGAGYREGLDVGAVSARSYEDRILIQRDGYAVMHNLGAGMILLTRSAARLVLDDFRNGYWPDNRATFCQLSGLDIGKWGAFRFNDQLVTADWHFEAVLAKHGLAALALTPAKAQMVGQIPPLAEQGLKLVEQSVDGLCNGQAFDTFVDRTARVRRGELAIDTPPFGLTRGHEVTVFPHQIPSCRGVYAGDWRLKWSQGFGPFAWVAGVTANEKFEGYGGSFSSSQNPTLTVPVFGPCAFLVSGGKSGGKVRVEDTQSGYSIEPDLEPEGPDTQVLALSVPGGVVYRNLILTALTPGIVFYGLSTRDSQPRQLAVRFTHATLPPV